MSYDSASFHDFASIYLTNAGFPCSFHVTKAAAKEEDFMGIATIFRMKSSYRDFRKYIDPLTQTFQRTKGMMWRLYYDQSTEKDVAAFKRFPHVELVKFDFPDFRIPGDGGYHQGCFGTIPRLLNLFDFAGRHPQALMTDADLGICDVDVAHIKETLQGHDVYAMYYDCVEGIMLHESRASCTNGAFTLMAFNVARKPIDPAVLVGFLRSLTGPFVQQWASKIAGLKGIPADNTTYGPFYYGIDEILINCWIVPEWLARGYSLIGVRNAYNVAKFHYALFKKTSGGKTMPAPMAAAIARIMKPYIPGLEARHPEKMMQQVDQFIFVKAADQPFSVNLKAWHEYMLYLCDLYVKGRIQVDNAAFKNCPKEYLKHRDLYITYTPDVAVLTPTKEQLVDRPRWKVVPLSTSKAGFNGRQLNEAVHALDPKPAFLLFAPSGIPKDAHHGLTENPRTFLNTEDHPSADEAIMLTFKDFVKANGFSNGDRFTLVDRLEAAGIPVFTEAGVLKPAERHPVTANEDGWRELKMKI